MTCGPVEGITIEIPTTGVEVRPTDIDIREQKRAFARGQFELTEAAGKAIDQNAPEAATVLIKVDNEPTYRMYLPNDAISYETSLQNDTVAKLSVLDARQVLRRGSIEKSFGDTTPRDIVDYIIGEKDDPDGIIQGYEFIDEESSELELNLATTGLAPESIQNFQISAGQAVDGFLDIDHFHDETDYAGFNFDGESPLEAMQETMSEFAVNWFVDDDGILYIGMDGARSQLTGTVAGDNELALSRYTVTKESKTTNAVNVVGPINIDYVKRPPALGGGPRGNGLRTIADARAPSLEGTGISLPEERRIFEQEKLESVAVAALVQEVMDDYSGSMEVNALASRNMDAIRALSVGDYIGVDESVETRCNQDVITGLFMVTGVHHLASPQRGWKIRLDVSRIPNMESIETSSVLYDPEEDREYESMEAYETAQDEEEDDGGLGDLIIPQFVL